MDQSGRPDALALRVALTADLCAPQGGAAFGGGYLDELAHIEWSVLPTNRVALLPSDLTGVNALVHFSGNRLTREVIESTSDLVLVARLGVGCDPVDVEACTSAGVLVTITPDAVRGPMAQGAMALMLALAHRLTDKERAARSGAWAARVSLAGRGLEGRVLGIVGLGNIGGEVARLADQFGMEVIAYGPRLTGASAVSQHATAVDLDHLMARADYVCVCCPLNAQTEGLLSRSRLALMRPEAYFVNIARGGVVDEEALTEMLRDHRIAGAALDVFCDEPLSPDNPLLSLQNVVLTPHAVGYTTGLFDGMMKSAATAVADVARGRVPRHVANPQVLSHVGLKARLEQRLWPGATDGKVG